MKTLPGATKVLQLASVNGNQHLLDFVVSNLFVHRVHRIHPGNRSARRLAKERRDSNYDHVFDYASGSGDTSEEAVWDSLSVLGDMFSNVLREGNVELVAAMLSNSVISPIYDAWINYLDIYFACISGTLEAVIILTSVEVMGTLSPSLYKDYGALLQLPTGIRRESRYQYVDHHVKAIERLYAALGYIPEAVKMQAIYSLNMDDEQFINSLDTS